MRGFRSHLGTLDEADDLLRVKSRVHWMEAAVIGGEAAERNGPALVFENTPGHLRFASGVYGGPDNILPRHRRPWTRLAQALDAPQSYLDCLNTISSGGRQRTSANDIELDAAPIDAELYSLGLPALRGSNQPVITLGLLVYESERGTVWAPIRGAVRGGDRMSGVVPRAVAESIDESNDPVSIVLGVPAAALVATHLCTADGRPPTGVPELACELDEFPIATTASGTVPAESEVVLSGNVSEADNSSTRLYEAWEFAVETATIDITVTGIATREDPIIPFAPTHAALSDDVHLVSIVEAARLDERINSYWGIEPVKWISLPVEAGLGMCLVASEILYAGFEWQLANTLFSFSRLFDKVLVLDEAIEPADLARSFDDIWVRAHPAHDWEFSEPSAPAATRPSYRRDGKTGSRLYINAAWDPRWDETYIAPRVTFESSFPEEIRASVREQWTDFGFDRPFRGKR